MMKVKKNIVIILSLGILISFMTGCAKKETQENQDHSSVKIVENSGDVEFKAPSKK
ncbi:hypothetical protein [Lactococcus petauri]|uniref:hypothetical protein n=1 Tax=Lactococcus petauri TaxID=1940789 RepID=UPI0038550D58